MKSCEVNAHSYEWATKTQYKYVVIWTGNGKISVSPIINGKTPIHAYYDILRRVL